MTSGAAVAQFLGRVRRRSILTSLLTGCLVAAAINEAFRWVSIGALILWRLRVPVLDVGPLIVAMLVPYLVRRWSPAAAARRADARLGLSDRLISSVDFAVRDDVPGDVRVAQARETERALAGARPAAAVPIRVWRAAGPLLLVASLIYPYFLFTATETTTTRVLRRLGAGGDRGGEQEPAADDPHASLAPEDDGGSAGTPQPGAEEVQEGGEGAVSPAQPGAEQAAAGRPLDAPRGEGPLPAPQDESEAAHAPAGGGAAGPEQLVSERVGRALAKVVDPVYSPGEETSVPPAVGSVSVNLVPRSRPGGAGGAPGTGSPGRRVTVDLDALPEQYRPLVKTYFELLADETAAAGEPTTPPARSGKP